MEQDVRRFKVIEGGLDKPVTYTGDQSFRSAWITDTRLMGVFCMGVHWRMNKKEKAQDRDLHQYFYFDAEDLGFDRFEWVFGKDKTKLEDTEASMIGCLGGSKVDIDLVDAIYLLKKYVHFNEVNGLPLPNGKENYMFMTSIDVHLSDAAARRLLSKCCIRFSSKTELANYFIMRYVARDTEALSILCPPNMPTPAPCSRQGYILYKNDVSPTENNDVCRCASLVGNDAGYRLLVSELEIKNMLVCGFKLISNMEISDAEAYMNLSHSEFVTIYDYSGPSEVLNRQSSRLTKNAMIMNEHGGTTCMMLRSNNEHVNKKNYKLYDDMMGIYHLTGDGQLIIAANSLDDIQRLEMDLTFSTLYADLKLKNSYEFNEPVLAQYLESDFSDFMDFIDAIKLD
ncbi:hypothetical protein [Aminicella lysinilytica]|uniref:Uncharacterized protein n=1 Tax=Aminicella lysinilytica TaxID=433323 RepID=A0A4R6QDV9_9FIRM|nr:hypothetical protein [Aminicella lysinilytica]NLD11006.1 hypothetical protein [Clostridiales bacterium]TDP60575.1 hypothetical protein EV211_10189 [Aminicella lysinilytica]